MATAWWTRGRPVQSERLARVFLFLPCDSLPLVVLNSPGNPEVPVRFEDPAFQHKGTNMCPTPNP